MKTILNTKFIRFIVALAQKSHRDEIIPLAFELSHRLILALFPFIIFLITLVGFLNLDFYAVMDILEEMLPDEMMEIIGAFAEELIGTRHIGLMSGSLVLAVISASSGFKAIIRGINRAYGTKETRKFIHAWLIRASLVFVLAFALISSMLLLVFGDTLLAFFTENFGYNRYVSMIFGLTGDLAMLAVLLATIVFIYKFGSCKKLSVVQVLPGALVTLIVWIAASGLFNFYINNFEMSFTALSVVYSSIAGVFITMLWINIISAIILLGIEINSLLDVK